MNIVIRQDMSLLDAYVYARRLGCDLVWFAPMGRTLAVSAPNRQSNIGRRKLPRRQSHPATKQPEPPEAV